MVYLDTSSLVKLYIKETGSLEVIYLVSNASLVLTSMVAYAETRAAFAKQQKNRNLTQKELSGIKVVFEDDWRHYLIIGINEEISHLAGDLAEKHGLRGFDAIHLASYLFFKGKVKKEIIFSSSDNRLNDAARKENPGR
jgi:predicted nucleic acid-binding protein